MKKSLLALAMSLAAISGANASWDAGATFPDVGNGEALLTVFDNVNFKSYALDLGIRYDDLVSGAAFNGQTKTVDLSVFGGSLSNVQWHVAAASSQYVNSDYTEERFDKYGFLITTAQGTTRSVAGATPEAAFNLYSGVVNQFVIGAAAGLQMNAGTAADNTGVSGVAPANAYVGGTNWGTYFDGKLSGDSLGAIGETLDLWRYGFAGAESTSNPIAIKLGSISLVGNTLTFNAAAPEVPVPAAVWLMGSALAGLGGIARSRRKA